MKATIARIGPLRVPIVSLFVLVYLPSAALIPAAPGSSLVRGLFDLTALTPDGGLWRTFLTFFVAWLALSCAIVAVYQSAAMIHDFAPARFQRPGHCTEEQWLWLPGWWGKLVVIVPIELSLAASLSASLDDQKAAFLGVALVGAVAAASVALLLLTVIWGCAQVPRGWSRRAEDKFTQFLARFDTSGYVRTAECPFEDPFQHHLWASLFLSFSVLVWMAVGAWAILPSIQPCIRVPALCSLYLLLMFATWFLSSLTFFFDYYRIPVLTMLLLPFCLVGFRDHLYDARSETVASRPLLPAEVVEKRIGKNRPPVIAISAAGGGIQAAAWTARVLERLLETAGDRRDELLQRIVVLSGVSGGSVGIAPLLLALVPREWDDDPGSVPQGGKITEAAMASSLDRVAATWATLDLFPFWWGRDRGHALEHAWKSSWEGIGLPHETRLSRLAELVADGRMPAVMFNATSMTTGERLILGTTIPTAPLPIATLEPDDSAGRETGPPRKNSAPGLLQSAVVTRDSAGKRGIGYRPSTILPDVDLATAVRLSATFPFVTPASHCSGCEGATQYLVDGGYIDNSGMQSLTEWIEALLRGAKVGQTTNDSQKLHVTVVQIVPFREEKCPEKVTNEQAPSRSAGSDAGAEEQNWFAFLTGWLHPSQVAVPLRTVFNIRGPGQARDAIDERLDLEAEFPGQISSRSFVYDHCATGGFDPPLSWHLTNGQREDIKSAWGPEDDAEASLLIQEVLGPQKRL
jgi:hypothetical protein